MVVVVAVCVCVCLCVCVCVRACVRARACAFKAKFEVVDSTYVDGDLQKCATKQVRLPQRKRTYHGTIISLADLSRANRFHLFEEKNAFNP